MGAHADDAGRARHFYTEYDAAAGLATEIVQSLTVHGVPPAVLLLLIGVPYILLRNLAPWDGLANGSHFMILTIRSNTLLCVLINGAHAGETFTLHRTRFVVPADPHQPEWVRVQFPCKLAFVLTINKVAGQAFKKVGVYLPTQCFAHGQCYAALTRATDIRRLLVWNGRGDNRVVNIVLQDALMQTPLAPADVVQLLDNEPTHATMDHHAPVL